MTSYEINLEASLAASIPSADAIADNPIWRLLADAGIDWTMGVAETERLYGRRFDEASQSWQLCYPTHHTAFDNMLHSVGARAWEKNHPLCPPDSMGGYYYTCNNVRANVAMALAQLSPYLGEGEPHRPSNVVGRMWAYGDATLKVYGFPPEQNTHSGSNSYCQRDSRLIAATTLAIQPGFRLILADEERPIVEGAKPLLSYQVTRMQPTMYAPQRGATFPYHRYSERAYPILGDAICLSADDRIVMAGSPQQFVLIDRSAIQNVTVERMSRARGGAYSAIVLNVADVRGHNGLTSLRVMDSDETEGCTSEGEKLAKRLGVTWILGQVYPND